MPAMNTLAVIEKELAEKGIVTSEMVAKLAGITRQAAHKQLAALVKRNRLIKVGTTRKTYYVSYSARRAAKAKKEKQELRLRLINKGLQEDLIFDRLEITSGSIKRLPGNTKDIFKYAFSEMLNNAIEHSKTKNIEIIICDLPQKMVFDIVDRGVGIYNNLKRKYHLAGDLEAVQELLKGKRTTAPRGHTGEGIFFTSKISDYFKIESAKTALIIDNKNNDVLVEEIKARKGTKVSFQIGKKTKKKLKALFAEYTDEEYEFHKTKVLIKLYAGGVDYVSRSQGRRVVFGLEKFKEIVLDFNRLKGIGQGFADEIFRVFARSHPQISILPVQANAAVMFMINRAKASG